MEILLCVPLTTPPANTMRAVHGKGKLDKKKFDVKEKMQPYKFKNGSKEPKNAILT